MKLVRRNQTSHIARSFPLDFPHRIKKQVPKSHMNTISIVDIYNEIPPAWAEWIVCVTATFSLQKQNGHA